MKSVKYLAGMVGTAWSLAGGAAVAATGAVPAPKVEFVQPPAGTMSLSAHDLSPVSMYLGAGGVVKTVIIILLLASLLTWTICIAKAIELRRERRKLHAAFRALAKVTELHAADVITYGAVAEMVIHAEDEIALSGAMSGGHMIDGTKDRIAMRLDRIAGAVGRRLGRGMSFLAIIGSTAPFVGLFGTVWGIMNSFIGIAESKTTNLAVVAPGIAEALLTTAFGLVAAIPAVVTYNLFSRMLSGYRG